MYACGYGMYIPDSQQIQTMLKNKEKILLPLGLRAKILSIQLQFSGYSFLFPFFSHTGPSAERMTNELCVYHSLNLCIFILLMYSLNIKFYFAWNSHSSPGREARIIFLPRGQIPREGRWHCHGRSWGLATGLLAPGPGLLLLLSQHKCRGRGKGRGAKSCSRNHQELSHLLDRSPWRPLASFAGVGVSGEGRRENKQ